MYISNNKKIATFLFLFVFLLNTFSFGQDNTQNDDWYIGKTIKNIEFNGLKHVGRGELKDIFEKYTGEKLTDDLYLEILGVVNSLEYFESVTKAEVAPAGDASVTITFDVVERPVVANIKFTGNSKLRTGTLRDVVTTKAGDLYRPEKVSIDRDNIGFKYVEEGFPNAKVDVKTVINNNGSVDLTFEINEGKRITVSSISFGGDKHFSERTLRSQISTKEKGTFSSGAFEEIKLANDKLAIENYYRDRGYIRARVVDITRDYTTDANGDESVRIVFQIDEGGLYTFEGVDFKGNYVFSTEQLESVIRSKKGQFVNAQRLEMDLQNVQSLYQDNGYIFSQITRKELRDDEEMTLKYELDITENDRAYIEKITVKFMDDVDSLKTKHKTKPFVILRALPFEEGDIFSKSKIEDGYRNLNNLQYFANIQMTPVQGSEFGLMELDITVEEQPTTDIQAGLTFSGQTDVELPISLQLKWTDRNFLGLGNVFGISANVSPDLQNGSVQYTQNYLFGLPLSGSLNLLIQHATKQGWMGVHTDANGNQYPDGFNSYSDYYNQSGTYSDEYLFDYEQWYVSLGFNTGYVWRTRFGNLSLGGGPSVGIKINQFNRKLYVPFDETIRQNPNPMPALSLSLVLSLDNRDIYYDPTRGYYLSQRLGFYGLLPKDPVKVEEEYYTRTDSKAEIFFKLWDLPVGESWAFRGVLGLHTGFSFILPSLYGPFNGPPSSKDIEDTSKLYIDGMFIGRGWTSERNIYGYSMWENWAELRMPIVPNLLSLDGIFDAVEIGPQGNEHAYSLFDSVEGLRSRMRFSTGFGLRFSMPQFPFRFLFVKRFVFNPDGSVKWEPGAIGGDHGLDFVLSFALSTY